MPSVDNLYALFPKLRTSDHSVTSPFDRGYNCVAWLAEDTTKWWEPPGGNGLFWPDGLPVSPDRDAYLALFQKWGFETCDSGTLEAEKEKIAIWFAGDDFLHVAKQLENGWWSSKLGTYHDVSHAGNECICGENANEYSSDPEFMVRSRKQSHPLPRGIPDLGHI